MRSRQAELCHIALGANQGQRLRTLRRAIEAMMGWPDFDVIAVSRPYCSLPVNAQGGEFVNAVIAAKTRLAPESLLTALLDLETRLGRVRSASTKAARRAGLHEARAIDLDLLTHGRRRIQSKRLTLPHPRMHLRAFVLAPMADVAPHHVLITGQTVLEALAQLPDRGDVTPMLFAKT